MATENTGLASTVLPAEWAPQSAVMLTWPHIETDWKDMLGEVEETYFEIARAILRDEDLIVSCEDGVTLARVKDALERDLKESGHRLFAYQVPADDTWARDHGPITVQRQRQNVLLDFKFNAWGNKYASSKDDLITKSLLKLGAFGPSPLEQIDFVLEGGSIESDGAGTILTTIHCLLSDERNPGLEQQEIEARLETFLGAKRVLWLSSGYLRGDDTDAHIDTLARFCSKDTICYVHCEDPDDEHYEALNAMEAQLQTFCTDEGAPYRLVKLPMPEAQYHEGRRLPATYANFLITNHSILTPIYGCGQDERALESLRGCFPDREVVPINCSSLIKQNGSLHCITMQIPQGVSA